MTPVQSLWWHLSLSVWSLWWHLSGACGDVIQRCPAVSGAVVTPVQRCPALSGAGEATSCRVQGGGCSSPGSGEGTVPLGCCALGSGLALLWSPEKQGLILLLLSVVQLLVHFPGAAEGSWTVTQLHHLGTATKAQLLRARGELVSPTGLGLLPGVSPGPEPSGRAGGELGHLSRGSHHPSCQGLGCPHECPRSC